MNIPLDVLKNIASFLPKYHLAEWLPKDKIVSISLCQNPHPYLAVFLQENRDKIDIVALSNNNSPELIPVLDAYVNDNQHYLGVVSRNPNAISIIEKYLKDPSQVKPESIRGGRCLPQDRDLLDWYHLSENPNAIPLLEKHLDKIWLVRFARNPNAMSILEKNLDIVDWSSLSENPNAIPLLEKHIDKICWITLSKNPNAIPLLEKHLDKVDWINLSGNPNAIPILEKHLDKVDLKKVCAMQHPDVLRIIETYPPNRLYWSMLAANPYCLPLVEKHLDKIWWPEFCVNPNPNTIPMIEKNLDKLNAHAWSSLSTNPNAFHLLKKHQDKVDWSTIWRNPAIFEVDEERQIKDAMELDEILDGPTPTKFPKINR